VIFRYVNSWSAYVHYQGKIRGFVLSPEKTGDCPATADAGWVAESRPRR